MRKSFCFLFSFVSDAERSFWQSSLREYQHRVMFARNRGRNCSQEAPAIGSNARSVDIMRVPGPDRIETLRVQVKCSFQGRRIMKSEIGAKPIDDTRPRHLVHARPDVQCASPDESAAQRVPREHPCRKHMLVWGIWLGEGWESR